MCLIKTSVAGYRAAHLPHQKLKRHHGGSQNVVMGEELNQHVVRMAFAELTVMQGLHRHVDFPTHEREGSLDPVLSDQAGDCVVPPTGIYGHF